MENATDEAGTSSQREAYALGTDKSTQKKRLAPPPELTGALAPNYILTHGDIIYPGTVHGPESMVIDGDHIYTAGFDGYVTDLHKRTARRLARFGKGICGDTYAETTCGRPLGMRMDKDGSLLVIDTYYGLFRVHPVTGEYKTLYNASTAIEGQTGILLNDLDIGEDGKIYFTDSHDTFRRNEFPWACQEMRRCGRLLVYDPRTDKTEKLLDDLIFPNGVQLTTDKKGVLICETLSARIVRYDLKTKEVSVWSDNLPSSIDNIRYSHTTGTYWAGMSGLRKKDGGIDALGTKPGMRKNILGRIMSIDMIEVLEHHHGKAMGMEYGLVGEFDLNGNILRTFHDPKGEVVKSASEVHVIGTTMYVGSVRHDYIVQVNLTRALGSA